MFGVVDGAWWGLILCVGDGARDVEQNDGRCSVCVQDAWAGEWHEGSSGGILLSRGVGLWVECQKTGILFAYRNRPVIVWEG